MEGGLMTKTNPEFAKDIVLLVGDRAGADKDSLIFISSGYHGQQGQIYAPLSQRFSSLR
jgi:hypothetical protein